MSKFDDLNKKTIADPLTGGSQDVYTSKDGTFMMCIPDRAIPNIKANSAFQYSMTNPENKGIRVWSWEVPNRTEDAEFEIIQPKQLK